jgi:hypothetical protein
VSGGFTGALGAVGEPLVSGDGPVALGVSGVVGVPTGLGALLGTPPPPRGEGLAVGRGEVGELAAGVAGDG